MAASSSRITTRASPIRWGAKKDRRPKEIERELSPPQPHHPAAMVAFEGAPAGERDQDIEHGPDRREYPVWRIESGLREPGIPFARRGQEADRDPAAHRENEKPNQDKPSFHSRSPAGFERSSTGRTTTRHLRTSFALDRTGRHLLESKRLRSPPFFLIRPLRRIRLYHLNH